LREFSYIDPEGQGIRRFRAIEIILSQERQHARKAAAMADHASTRTHNSTIGGAMKSASMRVERIAI